MIGGEVAANSLAALVFRSAFRDVHLSPDSHPDVAPLVDSWKRVFPASVENPKVDFEDWVENAVRLHVALQAYPGMVAIADDYGRAFYLDGKPVEEGSAVIFLGTWLKTDDAALAPFSGKAKSGVAAFYRLATVDVDSISAAENYAKLKTFSAYANRDFSLCGFSPEGDGRVTVDIYEYLAELYRRGHRSAFVKVNRPKYGISRIKLLGESVKDARNSLAEDEPLSWATVHLEGQDNAFLVQEQVKMNHEYRVIVINHQPVAGAGCIEPFSPLDNESLWDTKTEEVRNDGEPHDTPDIVAKYQDLAARFCADLKMEKPECGCYTLDLALVNGKPSVIELNPLQNYGLYGMKYAAILEAEVAFAVERGFC